MEEIDDGQIMREVFMRRLIVFLLLTFMIASLISCGENTRGDSGKTVTSGCAVTDPVRYEDVVWTAMSEKMSEKEYGEFCEYLPALTGETVVHWQAEDDAYTEEDGFQGRDLTIQQMFEMVREDSETEDSSYGGVSSLLFWDLTGDGVKELVMETPYYEYRHFILHKQGNEFYGTAYVGRWFQAPQKSRYFWVGKGVGYWCYLTFKDEKYDIISVAGIQQRTKENGSDILEEYYIQDKKVAKKEYKEWEKENLTGEIKEYEMPEKEEVKHG